MAFNFKQKIKELEQAKRTLPAVIGNMAKRHFVQSFRDGGFTDVSLESWQARKTKDKSDRRTTKTRAILVKTGHGRGSIRVRVANFSLIEIGAYGVPYMSFHNKGAGKLPKRKFIGSSATLSRKIMARIDKEIKSVLR